MILSHSLIVDFPHSVNEDPVNEEISPLSYSLIPSVFENTKTTSTGTILSKKDS